MATYLETKNRHAAEWGLIKNQDYSKTISAINALTKITLVLKKNDTQTELAYVLFHNGNSLHLHEKWVKKHLVCYLMPSRSNAFYIWQNTVLSKIC